MSEGQLSWRRVVKQYIHNSFLERGYIGQRRLNMELPERRKTKEKFPSGQSIALHTAEFILLLLSAINTRDALLLAAILRGALQQTCNLWMVPVSYSSSSSAQTYMHLFTAHVPKKLQQDKIRKY